MPGDLALMRSERKRTASHMHFKSRRYPRLPLIAKVGQRSGPNHRVKWRHQ